ncbi:MAG: hypothetical protein LC108_06155 [Anaerolineales bacterium]|nr:hypothetical protein [Anaerolineales bacterium]
MDKKTSFLWALASGLIFPILQTLVFFLRFSASTPKPGLRIIFSSILPAWLSAWA